MSNENFLFHLFLHPVSLNHVCATAYSRDKSNRTERFLSHVLLLYFPTRRCLLFWKVV